MFDCGFDTKLAAVHFEGLLLPNTDDFGTEGITSCQLESLCITAVHPDIAYPWRVLSRRRRRNQRSSSVSIWRAVAHLGRGKGEPGSLSWSSLRGAWLASVRASVSVCSRQKVEPCNRRLQVCIRLITNRLHFLSPTSSSLPADTVDRTQGQRWRSDCGWLGTT